jgi:iron(II)-dependent oxidoreductase
MKTHEFLGQLTGMHQMMYQLIKSVPEEFCYQSANPEIPPMVWLYGRAIYVETYWLRDVLQGQGDKSGLVRDIFKAGKGNDKEVLAQLPPLDHLLNWALELLDDNVMRFANPGLNDGKVHNHPMMLDGTIPNLILQSYAELYEMMLYQLHERQLQAPSAYQVIKAISAIPPSTNHADIHQGHYRVGAKDDPAAKDNELPPQIVELSGYRIDRSPVTNGAWLGFIEAGGYENKAHWSDAGWGWNQATTDHQHPYTWRKDILRRWYTIGINGPSDLITEDPVSGISQYEATAYANWVSSYGEEQGQEQLKGAIVQHEYQWEVALRSQEVKDYGRVWEWCGHPFHSYTGYKTPEYAEATTSDFDAGHFPLRGGSIHTQLPLRRTSYRNHAMPEQRFRMSGTRLVFPPSIMPWNKK